MDVYTIITNRIIEKLEAGCVPWHKPWRSIGVPRNVVSKKAYRGVNVWLLTMQGYTSPYWATIRQINELGGSVRTGEKATPVVFWRVYVDGVEVKAGEHEPETEGTDGQSKRRFVLRYYACFNTEQCDLSALITDKLALPEQQQLDPIEACEKILAGMPDPPEIVHAGDKAFYSPMTDRITMPPRGLFETTDDYWCTLWHEESHATGHPRRLNRDSIKDAAPFGSETYSIEECIAEMAAAYLCGIAGIANRTIDNSAAYIAGWLREKLRDDRKLIVHAAAQAQKACDYVLNVKSGG